SAALEGQFALSFARGDAELWELLGRGHLSCVVVAGADEPAAVSLVQRLSAEAAEGPAGAGAEEGVLEGGTQIVLAAPCGAEAVAALFNQRALHRYLRPPLEGTALRDAVHAATREHEMRIEQHRMALELERNLLRERARWAPPPAARDSEGV